MRVSPTYEPTENYHPAVPHSFTNLYRIFQVFDFDLQPTILIFWFTLMTLKVSFPATVGSCSNTLYTTDTVKRQAAEHNVGFKSLWRPKQ